MNWNKNLRGIQIWKFREKQKIFFFLYTTKFILMMQRWYEISFIIFTFQDTLMRKFTNAITTNALDQHATSLEDRARTIHFLVLDRLVAVDSNWFGMSHSSTALVTIFLWLLCWTEPQLWMPLYYWSVINFLSNFIYFFTLIFFSSHNFLQIWCNL